MEWVLTDDVVVPTGFEVLRHSYLDTTEQDGKVLREQGWSRHNIRHPLSRLASRLTLVLNTALAQHNASDRVRDVDRCVRRIPGHRKLPDTVERG